MMTLGYTQEQKEQTEKTCEKVLRAGKISGIVIFKEIFKKKLKEEKVISSNVKSKECK